jgi:hypothetical protein
MNFEKRHIYSPGYQAAETVTFGQALVEYCVNYLEAHRGDLTLNDETRHVDNVYPQTDFFKFLLDVAQREPGAYALWQVFRTRLLYLVQNHPGDPIPAVPGLDTLVNALATSSGLADFVGANLTSITNIASAISFGPVAVFRFFLGMGSSDTERRLVDERFANRDVSIVVVGHTHIPVWRPSAAKLHVNTNTWTPKKKYVGSIALADAPESDEGPDRPWGGPRHPVARIVSAQRGDPRVNAAGVALWNGHQSVIIQPNGLQVLVSYFALAIAPFRK